MKTLKTQTHSHSSSTSASNALHKLWAGEWYWDGGCLSCWQVDCDLCYLVAKVFMLPGVPLERTENILTVSQHRHSCWESTLWRQKNQSKCDDQLAQVTAVTALVWDIPKWRVNTWVQNIKPNSKQVRMLRKMETINISEATFISPLKINQTDLLPSIDL